MAKRSVSGPLVLSCLLLAACGDQAARSARNQQSDDASTSADPGAPVGDSSAVVAPADDAATIDAAAAADVLRRYYDAIASRRYREAWVLWSGGGAASGQSFDTFVDGFAETVDVEVEIGAPGRIEGAAGSRYVELPVVVRAITTGGARQRFEGSYTLRRSVVDGATPDQRAWRIHSASIREVE